MNIPSKQEVERVLNSLEADKPTELLKPHLVAEVKPIHAQGRLQVERILRRVDDSLAALVGKR